LHLLSRATSRKSAQMIVLRVMKFSLSVNLQTQTRRLPQSPPDPGVKTRAERTFHTCRRSGHAVPVYNPSRAEVIAEAPAGGAAEVAQAVDAGRKVWPGWGETPVVERARSLPGSWWKRLILCGPFPPGWRLGNLRSAKNRLRPISAQGKMLVRIMC
jgi:aldehyde dehydrogenase family protein